MEYISTRGQCDAVTPSQAINQGLAPDGGLYVPRVIPKVLPSTGPLSTYADTALRVLEPLLSDFTREELVDCIGQAYAQPRFDTNQIIELPALEPNRWVLELWHGPTAAFKDMALQIMPLLLGKARTKVGETAHTVILVATSGDTGKAALEGFRDREGVSIIVFYPHEGVSQVQQLQMSTTEGNNTHVVAVRGNFDDCQNGVKELFGNRKLVADLASQGVVFSSANSINWGRLCPQIAYYYRAYELLVARGHIVNGQEISFAVPTGNFGNILSAWYARQMGLPIKRLFCASNRNRILSDFFTSGCYDRNRQFYRTRSPSMDILISSNLERFLFEVSGHDDKAVCRWYNDLAATGQFCVEPLLLEQLTQFVVPGWVDEDRVLDCIGEMHSRTGYILDPHTAVAASVCAQLASADEPVVIDSTASPYKFPADVLQGLGAKAAPDEFAAIDSIRDLGGPPIHAAVKDLRDRPVRHSQVIDRDEMESTVRSLIAGMGNTLSSNVVRA